MSMLKPWMVIGLVTFAIALFSNILRPKDIKWFRRLQRPQWLIFEKLIPVIWSLIFVCGAISAHQIWQQQPGSQETWLLMGGYIILELLIVAFSPVLLWSRSLMLATIVGAIGCLWGLLLTVWLTSISGQAALLLIPYLLWGPVGSYTTWSMYQLNQAEQQVDTLSSFRKVPEIKYPNLNLIVLGIPPRNAWGSIPRLRAKAH